MKDFSLNPSLTSNNMTSTKSIDEVTPHFPIPLPIPNSLKPLIEAQKTIKSVDKPVIKHRSFEMSRDIPSTTEKCEAYEQLRCLCPDQPEKLGTSITCPSREFCDNHFQAGGGEYGGGLKFEYNQGANKYSLVGLDVENTFDLVPNAGEAGGMNSEILDAGFDVAPFFIPRSNGQHWYGITTDEENFYYAVWGNGVFQALFDFGTSTIFVSRKKSDCSLNWVKSIFNYTLNVPKEQNVTSKNQLARLTAAICGDRLYTGSFYSNIGPQLFCIDKNTGDPIWTMAYYLPVGLVGFDETNRAMASLQSPSTPLGSVNGTPYIGQTMAISDMHIVAKELEVGKTSIFIGTSSFQNAINPASFVGFPFYTDQGFMFRIDDTGSTGVKVWATPTCARPLKAGDVIAKGGSSEYDPFRPDACEVLIWRDTTENGKFEKAIIMNYKTHHHYEKDCCKFKKSCCNTGCCKQQKLHSCHETCCCKHHKPSYCQTAQSSQCRRLCIPGYKPFGYPNVNNNTVPIISNILLIKDAPLPSIANIWKNIDGGIGSKSVIYLNDQDPPITRDYPTLVNYLQGVLSQMTVNTQKFTFWAYVDCNAIERANAKNWGDANQGVRYVAGLPSGYVLNAQEANALNYYGNSTWGQQPVLDAKRNLLFFGTGQSHEMVLDEVLFYQNPKVDYFDRKQKVINTMYQYTQNDATLGNGPYSTLDDVNNVKDQFCVDTNVLNLKYNDKSPRGNASYSDAIMAIDLDCGKIVFGYRSVPWDSATFVQDDPKLLVIRVGLIDGDMSSGVCLMEDVQTDEGNKDFIIGVSKNSMAVVLDISGLNEVIEFNNDNLRLKGVDSKLIYAGPDGALGGSNFGFCNDGGNMAIYSVANASPLGFATGETSIQLGAASYTYTQNFYKGYEFHVTRDGRVFQIQESLVGAIDVSKKEIVWEVSLGQRSNAVMTCYNGVAWTANGNGLLYGFDVSTGALIWKYDGRDNNGLGGINAPTWDNGSAFWICNYALGGIVGSLGNTGLKLSVNKSLIPDTDDTISTLVENKTFNSYDVNPKLPGTTAADALVTDETVKHEWSVSGALTATHTYNSVPQVLNFTAKTFLPGTRTIVFEKPNATADVRYENIKLINKNNYLLNYYRHMSNDGCHKWELRQATLQIEYD